MKIISWNVNGLRSILKKGFLDFVDTYDPDILCLQETKAITLGGVLLVNVEKEILGGVLIIF